MSLLFTKGFYSSDTESMYLLQTKYDYLLSTSTAYVHVHVVFYVHRNPKKEKAARDFVCRRRRRRLFACRFGGFCTFLYEDLCRDEKMKDLFSIVFYLVVWYCVCVLFW